MKNLWTISLTLLALFWPFIHILVLIARFGQFPSDRLVDSAIFLPMGVVSAGALVVLFQMAQTRGPKVGAIVGYSLTIPVAFVGSLFSGLMFPPLVGTLLYGALPLVLGTVLGYVLGSVLGRLGSALAQRRS